MSSVFARCAQSAVLPPFAVRCIRLKRKIYKSRSRTSWPSPKRGKGTFMRMPCWLCCRQSPSTRGPMHRTPKNFLIGVVPTHRDSDSNIGGGGARGRGHLPRPKLLPPHPSLLPKWEKGRLWARCALPLVGCPPSSCGRELEGAGTHSDASIGPQRVAIPCSRLRDVRCSCSPVVGAVRRGRTRPPSGSDRRIDIALAGRWACRRYP